MSSLPATPSRSIQPIETSYGSHRFRSRLEARWAVFFDQLGLRWEYEVEGFQLEDGTRYLPDFKIWTPQGRWRWVEVKPSSIDSDSKFLKFQDEAHKAFEFAELVSGSPLQWLEQGYTFCPRCGLPSHNPWDEWFYCQACDYETPCGGGHGQETTGVAGTTWKPHKGSVCVEWDELMHFASVLRDAAEGAQQARFEFGN